MESLLSLTIFVDSECSNLTFLMTPTPSRHIYCFLAFFKMRNYFSETKGEFRAPHRCTYYKRDYWKCRVTKQRVKTDMHIAQEYSHTPHNFDLSCTAADRLVHHPMTISQETPLSRQEKMQLKFSTLSTENIFLSVYVVVNVLTTLYRNSDCNLCLRLCLEFRMILISV